MFSFKSYKAEALLAKDIFPKKCSFCRKTQDENFDEIDGKLYSLELAYRDSNRKNQNASNIVLVCKVCKRFLKDKILIRSNPSYEDFRGTGRV